MKMLTADPYPRGFREQLAKDTREDVGRIARREVVRGNDRLRPRPDVARWIAAFATSGRVRGVTAALFLAEYLRYELGVDRTQPTPPGKLRPVDVEWIQQLASDAVTQLEEAS